MALLHTIQQGIFDTSSTRIHNLGDIHFRGGKKYVYVQAKETITAHNVLMMTAPSGIDNVHAGFAPDNTTAVTTLGHKYPSRAGKYYAPAQILFYGTGGLTPNTYAGYHLVTDDSTDTAEEGLVAIIEANDAYHLYLDIALSTTCNAADNDTDITFFHPYHVEPISASTQVIPVGASRIAVTDEYYFWMQSEGVASILYGETGQVVNVGVQVGDDTDGTGLQVDNADDYFAANLVGHIVAGGDLDTGSADTALWVKLNVK